MTQTKTERLFIAIGGSFVLTVDSSEWVDCDKTSEETAMTLMTLEVPLNWQPGKILN